MQRAERRRAHAEARSVRTLTETDYLLGVRDISRLGALRFRMAGQKEFLAPLSGGVPGMVRLGDLLLATQRIMRDEESDADLELVLAPGSSLGGARPKCLSRISTTGWPSQNFPRIPTTTAWSCGNRWR